MYFFWCDFWALLNPLTSLQKTSPHTIPRLQSTHGAPQTILDGTNTHRIAWFDKPDENGTVLSGFTFRGGKASTGGCVGFGGDVEVVVEDCLFVDCRTSAGSSDSLGQEQVRFFCGSIC